MLTEVGIVWCGEWDHEGPIVWVCDHSGCGRAQPAVDPSFTTAAAWARHVQAHYKNTLAEPETRKPGSELWTHLAVLAAQELGQLHIAQGGAQALPALIAEGRERDLASCMHPGPHSAVAGQPRMHHGSHHQGR